MTLAATVGAVSLLNSTVLASTRMPFAMAEDGYISHWLTRQHPRYRTPAAAIVISCAIYAVFAWHSLTQLISVYIWLRIATSLLTVLSGWQLRRKAPDLPRAFRIPWGRKGLMYAVLAPVVMSGVALLGSDPFGWKWGPAALLLGPVAYIFFRRRPAASAEGAGSGR
jgi:amino acid transporter